MALFCRANRAERCPQLGVERPQRGGRHWAVDDVGRIEIPQRSEFPCADVCYPFCWKHGGTMH
jgi:hypothetical protein